MDDRLLLRLVSLAPLVLLVTFLVTFLATLGWLLLAFVLVVLGQLILIKLGELIRHCLASLDESVDGNSGAHPPYLAQCGWQRTVANAAVEERLPATSR